MHSLIVKVVLFLFQFSTQMDSVFIVFSGEYLCMEINSRHIEGILPVLRLEGVFTTEAKCEEWVAAHNMDKTINFLSFVEVPLNPIFGSIENDMQVFKILMNENLQITQTSMGDSSDIPQGESYTIEFQDEGNIYGVFWARDLIDACKIAFIKAMEFKGKNGLVNNVLH